MARRINRALASFGQSLMNSADKDTQNRLIMERQAAENAAISERQRVSDAAVTERQRLGKEQDYLQTLTSQLRAGTIQPGQLRQSETDALGGNTLALSPANSILSKPIFDKLAGATASGTVPSDRELFEQRRGAGPIRDLSDITTLFDTAADTRQRISNKEAADIDRKGAEAFSAEYNKGTAEEQLAQQNQPNVLARRAQTIDQDVSAEGRKAGARAQSEFNVKVKNAKQALDMEVERQRMLNSLEIDKSRQVAGMTAVQKAQENSTAALPRINELYTAWINAKDDVGRLAQAPLLGPAALEARVKVSYAGLPANVANYYRLMNAALPWVARLQGEVGNLADQEQIRQLYGLPNAYDAIQGDGGEVKLESLLALGLSAPVLARMNQNPNIINLPPDQRLDLVKQVIDDAKSKLAASRPAAQGATDDSAERAELIKKLSGGR